MLKFSEKKSMLEKFLANVLKCNEIVIGIIIIIILLG